MLLVILRALLALESLEVFGAAAAAAAEGALVASLGGFFVVGVAVSGRSVWVAELVLPVI